MTLSAKPGGGASLTPLHAARAPRSSQSSRSSSEQSDRSRDAAGTRAVSKYRARRDEAVDQGAHAAAVHSGLPALVPGDGVRRVPTPAVFARAAGLTPAALRRSLSAARPRWTITLTVPSGRPVRSAIPLVRETVRGRARRSACDSPRAGRQARARSSQHRRGSPMDASQLVDDLGHLHRFRLSTLSAPRVDGGSSAPAGRAKSRTTPRCGTAAATG